MLTITKMDLVALGYGPSFATTIIRQAKELMVTKGYVFYSTKKLSRVPVTAVEEILGIELDEIKLQTSQHTTCISTFQEEKS